MLLTLPPLQGTLQMADMLELPGDLLSRQDSPNGTERGKQHKRMHHRAWSQLLCGEHVRKVNG
jgi:hypothetical protein